MSGWTDDEIRELQQSLVNGDATHPRCENAPRFYEPEHMISNLERCQLVIGTRGDTNSKDRAQRAEILGCVQVPGTNYAVKRCAKCIEASKAHWAADVPFETFKWYLLGLIGSAPPGEAVALRWDLLKERLGL